MLLTIPSLPSKEAEIRTRWCTHEYIILLALLCQSWKSLQFTFSLQFTLVIFTWSGPKWVDPIWWVMQKNKISHCHLLLLFLSYSLSCSLIRQQWWIYVDVCLQIGCFRKWFTTRITIVIFLAFRNCVNMLLQIACSRKQFTTRFRLVIFVAFMNCMNVHLQMSCL